MHTMKVLQLYYWKNVGFKNILIYQATKYMNLVKAKVEHWSKQRTNRVKEHDPTNPPPVLSGSDYCMS